MEVDALQNDNLDDLFGSDSDNNEPAQLIKPGSNPNETTRDMAIDNNNQEMDGSISETSLDATDEAKDSPGRSNRHVEDEIIEKVSLPTISFPSTSKADLFLAKLPNFLDIDSSPFDLDTWQVNDEEEEEDNLKLKIENTIRWRYEKDAQGNITGKTSNARFIKWSDGSLALLLGEELFEINLKSVEQEQQYIVAIHHERYLQTQAKVKKVMSFRPHDTNSLTHKKLTMAIANKHKKYNKTKQHLVAEDPEKRQQAAEKLEMEKIRARRKLESKRKSTGTRFNAAALEDDDISIRRKRTADFKHDENGVNIDEYEEDDFVVEDEDEDEEKDRRIMKAKNGTVQRRRTYSDSEEEESEEASDIANDNSQDESEEEELDEKLQVKGANKKRAVFDSDDEE